MLRQLTLPMPKVVLNGSQCSIVVLHLCEARALPPFPPSHMTCKALEQVVHNQSC